MMTKCKTDFKGCCNINGECTYWGGLKWYI